MSAARVEARSGDAGDFSDSAAAARDDGLRVHTLRPRRSLGWSIGLPVAALALPLLGAELWVLGTRDAATIVVWTAAVTAVLTLAAWVAYRRTHVTISRYGIVERGFFGRRGTIATRDVAGVLRIQLYRSNSLETSHELFVVDRAGRGAIRMRGRFWETGTMDLVARLLEVEETVRTEPVTLAELRASDPKLLYWFERRSLLRR
ncbi:hypothetical protein [Agromyces ramosus]|uniref:PH (Pleckstrin Homology) domain-containing protein n=1 Tax=Agromyces ramosus TaxID=33879 RepID=A0ABU0RAX7_9MICO|nr:hypothetical protein [Agromyces ramosus]MDQ0895232.1 hypothetical protein [Agromyces ramosus]